MRRKHILEVLCQRVFLYQGMGEGRQYEKGVLLFGIKLNDFFDNRVEIVGKSRFIIGGGSHGDDDKVGHGAGKPGVELSGAFPGNVHDDKIIVRGNGYYPVLENLFLSTRDVME
jgi:hypothetical protein